MITDQEGVYEEHRPWGKFEQFTHNEPSTVKLLHVNPGEVLSLQYHHKRREFWRILAGDPIITLGQDPQQAAVGDEFTVDIEQVHRITGGTQHAVILEIAFGEFEENDIVRLEDSYGRVTPES